MDIAVFTLAEQLILTLAALMLFTSFLLLAQTRLLTLIHIFALQGGLLCATTLLIAFTYGRHHLLISAAITLGLKVFFIPIQLQKLVTHLDIKREVEVVGHPSLIMLGGAALVLFSYYAVLPIRELSMLATRNTIAVSLAIILLGMLLIISRRKAVVQVVGFMCMENGLMFAAISATHGMPMVVELGVALDVLVAAILFGIFFFQIRTEFGSLDVDKLNRLKEVD
ncbi:MAG: formate hydrogenlyase [Desulfuromonadaceae bacterium]|nr:formate hydrogenlyase [Geobacteraceae bacterium]